MLPKLKPNCLLAKSYESGHWRGSYSLVGHTNDVVNAVTTLVDILGNGLLEQFGLTCPFTHLRATARLAAYLHDWGKANDHFQGMIRARIPHTFPQRSFPHQQQMLRHEVVSSLLAWDFKPWLEQAPGDWITALVAAGGHHLKLGGQDGAGNDEFGEIRKSGNSQIYLYIRHPQFRGLLKYGVKTLGLPKSLRLSPAPSHVWTCQDIHHKQRSIREFLSFSWECDPVFLAVIKALLIAGDCAGSALAKETISPHQWIHNELNKTLDELKLNRVITSRLGSHSLRPFQQRLGEIKSRVAIAQAGCGTGKTLGAYHWAKTHALGRKLFFCYPTTGTSTEGFIDYVHSKVEATLFHSRYQIDLAMMTTGEERELQEGTESLIKLESFRAWGAESIVCTVDTVLGLLQCNRRPLYCFPAIAQAAFIFDETHCYDAKLFSTLLRFLQVIKAPILLMSASILPWQKQAIEEAVGEPIEMIEGDKDLEILPRYRFHVIDQPAWEHIEQELRSGGKVLWVCNQVNTAIDVYRQAKSRGLDPLLYHSRYRYQDRVLHHRQVVDAFKPDRRKPVLAICTQVAEMSLDLSATLLISQIADPPSLIQRLGRLNRQYCGRSLDAFFYPDIKIDFPYSADALSNGLKMIQHFNGEVSQSQLAHWLEVFSSEPIALKDNLNLVLLDGQWRTYPTSLREGGYNITAVLEQDLPKLKSLASREIPRYTLPIPNPKDKSKKWEKYKFFPIAPSAVWGYSEELGAFLLKNQEGNE